MTLDPHLSSRLKRLGDDLEPDVEGRFEDVVRTAHRRTQARRAGTAILETAAVIAVVAVLLVRGGPSPNGGQPSPSNQVPLAGAWTTTLASSDVSVVTNRLNGTWVIAFPASGVLEVTPPVSYLGPSSGYSFQVSGDTIRTDLLGADVCSSLAPGTYRYLAGAGAVTFRLVDDACAARVALLTTSPWQPASRQ